MQKACDAMSSRDSLSRFDVSENRVETHRGRQPMSFWETGSGRSVLAVRTVAVLGLFLWAANIKAQNAELSVSAFWKQQQAKHEAAEAEQKAAWKAFDGPPRFIHTDVDTMDKTPAFYAPIQGCKYLPEFQSIFTDGADGRYFTYAMTFGMKDIIRYHGHSCEHLYYTAAICRLLCNQLFTNGVVDRTLLRGMCGNTPCGVDSLSYITGGRLRYGTLRIEPELGHAIVLQRIDTGETWMGAWKDGVNSFNPVSVSGKPNQANPSPHKRWSAWKVEPETPESRLADCKIKWEYEQPEKLKRLRDVKDYAKYPAEAEKAKVDPAKMLEELESLREYHLRQVFNHPLAESFQIKRVPDFKWEYPHVEPLWVPRPDQRNKWAAHELHPEKEVKQ